MEFSSKKERNTFKSVMRTAASGVRASVAVDSAYNDAGTYENRGNIVNKVEEWVGDDAVPLQRKGDMLQRTDMEVER